MRITAIGAHPDDIEIYCSGFLAAAQAKGHQIDWIIATSGGGAGTGDGGTLTDRRQQEAQRAAALFGVTPVFLDRTDGALPSDSEATRIIEERIKLSTPDLVVTHAPNDYHPDHCALSRYALDAVSYRAPLLYCDTMLGIGFEPSFYIDVSAQMDRKRQALALHASQPTTRFLEIINVWNRFRGLQTGHDACSFAEAYRFEPRFPFGAARFLQQLSSLSPHANPEIQTSETSQPKGNRKSASMEFLRRLHRYK